MRFTSTAAILALASSVFAQTPGFDVISKPTKDEVIPAGSTYLIDWEPSSNWTGTVTIDLLGGPDQAGLQLLSAIAKSVDSAAGEYSWVVDKTIGKLKTYGIRISLDSDPTIFQYSFPFAIQSNSSSSSSSSDSTAAPTSTSTGGSDTTETTITTPTVTSAPTGGNLSTTGTPSKTLTTTTTGTSKTSPTGTTVSTNPGAIVRASSVALFGALALVFFTL